MDIAPTYTIYNQGYNPLTKWDEPPSCNKHYFVCNQALVSVFVAPYLEIYSFAMLNNVVHPRMKFPFVTVYAHFCKPFILGGSSHLVSGL